MRKLSNQQKDFSPELLTTPDYKEFETLLFHMYLDLKNTISNLANSVNNLDAKSLDKAKILFEQLFEKSQKAVGTFPQFSRQYSHSHFIQENLEKFLSALKVFTKKFDEFSIENYSPILAMVIALNMFEVSFDAFLHDVSTLGGKAIPVGTN